ncbi:Pyruvate decarboxylase 1 [Podospora pseudopauciseta]|uniref:Pyruvate decarboxylase n=1 Tax=Podospora pseudopauciseta TaxID=2093780 RepID=A0ABR0H8V5_9PEZI|nr:Pyruvate decarboxylase 1 [Podospora pseudopauciseta]
MSEILIGECLFLRLKQLGIGTVFGVPGDLVEPLGLSWVGAPNELIGAYAADGYARLNGLGALVTRFDLGELSALCGIGGSNCESVPVLHIVGYPTTPAQKERKDPSSYLGGWKLCCATTVLDDPTTTAAEIDMSILVQNSLDACPPSAPESEAAVTTEIVSRLELAKSPILIVSGGAARANWAEHVDPLIQALKIPFLVTGLGKGIADEMSPYYQGCYAGEGSWLRSAIGLVQEADCILWLGNYPSDFNTGIFTEKLDHCTIIDLQRFFVNIGATKYDARINHVLPKLIPALSSHYPLAQRTKQNPQVDQQLSLPASNKIEQDWLWSRLTSYLRPGDLVITETGTAQVGITATRFPSGCHGWTQSVYGSIGYAAGAAAGAAIAAKETGKYKRLVLVTGEGSLQLTVQAFSMLTRYRIVPVVFALNNYGYTIERYFRGWDAKYNDIPMWDYAALFKAFAPDVEPRVKGYKVTTAEELDELLSDGELCDSVVPQCVDMIMDPKDVPEAMRTVFEGKNAM